MEGISFNMRETSKYFEKMVATEKRQKCKTSNFKVTTGIKFEHCGKICGPKLTHKLRYMATQVTTSADHDSPAKKKQISSVM